MIYRFTEVLNDLMNYFILGDILLLESWKQSKSLPDDLAKEFTTNEDGDIAVQEGIILPMTGIENYPYTIIFNLSEGTPELLKKENHMQFRRDGYSIKVENNMLMLFTCRILEKFNTENVAILINNYTEHKRPMIPIENSWYSVEILGGEILMDTSYEPTFEFIIRKTDKQVVGEFDIGYNFTIFPSHY